MRISDWSSDVCSSDLVEAVKDECGKPCLRFGPNRPIQRDGIASPPTAQRKGEVGLVDVPGRDGFLHMEIERAHVCTPVTNAHLVCRLLLENQIVESHVKPRCSSCHAMHQHRPGH